MQNGNPEILKILEYVTDPEIPVLNIVEMGIVRGVRFEGQNLIVDITPTYSGCPAMKVMEDEIVKALHGAGFETVKVNTVFSPAWTTDWLTADAREKLREYGIAPPGKACQETLINIALKPRDVECPWCHSHETILKSEYGATSCKALHYCNSCKQPFEEFKAF